MRVGYSCDRPMYVLVISDENESKYRKKPHILTKRMGML